ncbi:MAG TPA: hypothetical protein ENK84_13430 [Desulfobulbus sp.]|nr:hypothetical protein [Desulfobulbus sp.]
MQKNSIGKVAVVCPGDRRLRQSGLPEDHRLMPVFHALTEKGMHVEAAVYHDDFCDEVHNQLLAVDAVLVWMNPIQDGRDRSILDAMLREVAATGVFVSTHPDIILKMGTKEVLFRTREIGWGSDVHLYRSMEQMRQEFPERLASGQARVVKQYRGNGGIGVWKVDLSHPAAKPALESIVRIRQGRRGSIEEAVSLEEFFTRCEQYFTDNGRMIDQTYQSRLPEGMIRCYLVQDTVAGFGHQEVVALYPQPPGAPPSEAPDPGPRLYYPPTIPQWQPLKQILEQEWVQAMVEALDMQPDQLPVLWDCDFLLGPKTASGEDTYVLCEINVSSVAPFPGSAPPLIAEVLYSRLHKQ